MTMMTISLMMGSALVSAGLAWLVATRGPCILVGRRCLRDGFANRFEEAQRSFRHVVDPAIQGHGSNEGQSAA